MANIGTNNAPQAEHVRNSEMMCMAKGDKMGETLDVERYIERNIDRPLIHTHIHTHTSTKKFLERSDSLKNCFYA